MEEKQVEILFRTYNTILEQDVAESIWADPVDASLGYYKLYSIPLYTSFIASDDVVHAEYDEDEAMFTYRETVQPSGNSTIWVVITDDDTDIDDVRKVFFEMDCLSEALSNRYFAMASAAIFTGILPSTWAAAFMAVFMLAINQRFPTRLVSATMWWRRLKN
jgi:hypothetical protein